MITLPATTLAPLLRFLVARVEEDDEELSKLHRHQIRSTAQVLDLDGIRSIDRQRAELDAKRHVIGQAQHLLVLRDLPNEKAVRDAATRMLCALAEPYRDHYAFRPEWVVKR